MKLNFFKFRIIFYYSQKRSSSNDCIQCPVNWISHNDHCYYISDKNATFDNASTFYNKNSAYLMKIDNKDEYNFLKSIHVKQSVPGVAGALWVSKKKEKKSILNIIFLNY